MTDDWKADRIRAAQDGRNPTLLAKLPESFAVIGDAQYLPGYCVLLVDDPAVDRLTDLPRDRRLRFLESMDHFGEAIQRACSELDPGFRRLNYEILGNTDAYLHAHIFARYEWEPADRIGGPVWRYDKALFYGEATELGSQHAVLRRRITQYL